MKDQNETIMETLKEELKTTAASRLNSPLIGAYLVSWLLWNHRMILTLLSGLPLDQRFHYIDEVLYPTVQTFTFYHLIGPALSTAFYIFLMPWPTEWVYRWNLYRKHRLRQAELRAEGHRLLTEEESVELQKKIGELRATLAEMRNDLTQDRRKIRALRIKTIGGRKGADIERINSEYITSQPFKIRAGRGDLKENAIIRFNRDHSVDVDGYRNMRWHFSGNDLHLFDAEQEHGALGSVKFAESSNSFEGQIEGLGAVQIKGVFSQIDFG